MVLLKELHTKCKACVNILLGACFTALAKPMDKQDCVKLIQTHGIKSIVAKKVAFFSSVLVLGGGKVAPKFSAV